MLSVEVFYQQTKTIRSCAWALEEISDALMEVGNERLAKRLKFIAEDIYTSADKIHNQVGTDLGEMVKNAEEHSTNMLRACLAGAALATKDKKLAKVAKRIKLQ
jgi:hypothetical protein